MANPEPIIVRKEDLTARINARIRREALDRLNAAVKERTRKELSICTQGTILSELILSKLKPVDGTDPAMRGPKSVKRAQRKAKTA